MFLQSFVTGILAFLIPSSLMMTVFVLIAFSNFKASGKGYLQNVIVFILIFTAAYLFLGFVLFKYPVEDISIINTDLGTKLLLTALNILFGIWVSGFIIIKSKNILYKKVSTFLILLLIGLVFMLSSLSGTGPIIGSLLIASMNGERVNSYILPSTGFALGLSMTISLIILLSANWLNRLNAKSWWRYVQISFGGIYLILSLTGLILFFTRS